MSVEKGPVTAGEAENKGHATPIPVLSVLRAVAKGHSGGNESLSFDTFG